MDEASGSLLTLSTSFLAYILQIPFNPQGVLPSLLPLDVTHSIPQLSNSAATTAAFLQLGLKEANSAERAFVCCSLCRASDPTPQGEEESELARLKNWRIRVRNLRLPSTFTKYHFLISCWEAYKEHSNGHMA